VTRGWVFVYNFCCPSPAQSFSNPNPARLTTVFYCLRSRKSLTICSYCPACNISARTAQKTRLIVVLQSFPWEHICCEAVTQQWPSYIRLFSDRYPATGLHATIFHFAEHYLGNTGPNILESSTRRFYGVNSCFLSYAFASRFLYQKCVGILHGTCQISLRTHVFQILFREISVSLWQSALAFAEFCFRPRSNNVHGTALQESVSLEIQMLLFKLHLRGTYGACFSSDAPFCN
jgi:hypothetical protein